MENIRLHHTCGLGILSQYSKNTVFDNVHIIPNAAKGRVLSEHDDGFHFKSIIELTEALSAGIKTGHVIENLTCTPNAKISFRAIK